MVFLWLAIANSVEKTRLSRARAGILGIDDVCHGNVGRYIENKQANTMRDGAHCMRKLLARGPKAFLRRFKIRRPVFDDLEEKIKHIVEPDCRGIEMARRSSETHVVAELMLAACLRWLAGGNYMCQEDNYGIGVTEFYKCLWEQVVYALDTVLPSPDFDIQNVGQMKGLEEGMLVRSGGKISGRIGALDGMAVRITRPTLKDSACPQTFFNRKGFYNVNL